ncbi:MAG: hypothetical protein CMLOHMNK_03082 [Steroidobacteraceae bacterium]|nr:hypothetical protein [Steroidobacteraceae bacterium]
MPVVDRSDVAFGDGRDDLHLGEILRDQEQLRRRQARGDRLADVDIALDDDAVDRRDDFRVGEILAGAIERHLCGLVVRQRHLAPELRRVELDFGEHLALEQREIAPVLDVRLLVLRATALDPRLRVAHRLLEQRRVDARDQLSLPHGVIEVRMDCDDAARDLRADLHRRHGAQRAGGRHRGADIGALDLREAIG